MDHYGGKDDGRTHAPVPFFVSSKGYGVLINAACYIDVFVGTGVRVDSKNPPVAQDRNTDKKWSSKPYSDNLEMVIPDEGVDLVLFAGENMLVVDSRGSCQPLRGRVVAKGANHLFFAVGND